MQNLNFFSSLKLCQLLSLLFALLIFSNQSWSSVGTVVLAVGEVEIQRAAETIQAKTGDLIEEKDLVTTRSGSRAQLKFSDNTVITLGSATEFSVAEFIGAETDQPTAKFHVGKGSFKTITGKIGQVAPKNFQLTTPTATIGIRGTIFSGRVTNDGDKIATLSGAITVTENQTGMMVDVLAGQMTEVVSGVAPTVPQPFEPGEMEVVTADQETIEPVGLADGSEESTGNESLQITALDNEVDEAVSVQPIEVAGFLDDKNELATEGGLLATGDGIVTGMISDDEMIMILNIYRDPADDSFQGAREDANNNYGVFKSFFDTKGIDGIVGFGTSSEVSGSYYAAGAFYNEAIDMVDQLLAGASSPTYNYSGGFIGEVTNTNGLLLGEITSSSLNLAITFGPELDISGDGSFVANGNLWSFDIFSNDGIEYLSVEGNGSADVSNIGGQMNGRFFGKDLEGVGGVYELTGTVVNEDLTATGAFKGTR